MKNRKRKPFWMIRAIIENLLVLTGAAGLTLLFFLVLPLMQTLAKPPKTDLVLMQIDTGELEAPPPPPEVEEEAPPEQEEAPPELSDEPQPLMDLSMLEIALNPGSGGGMMSGDFTINIDAITGTGGNDGDAAALFSVADLDQKPRVTYQSGPILNDKLRKAGGGTVYVIFIVDERGVVRNPKVQSSPLDIYNDAAVKAVKKWKFEPGKKGGKPVQTRMKAPVTFPKPN